MIGHLSHQWLHFITWIWCDVTIWCGVLLQWCGEMWWFGVISYDVVLRWCGDVVVRPSAKRRGASVVVINCWAITVDMFGNVVKGKINVDHISQEHITPPAVIQPIQQYHHHHHHQHWHTTWSPWHNAFKTWQIRFESSYLQYLLVS